MSSATMRKINLFVRNQSGAYVYKCSTMISKTLMEARQRYAAAEKVHVSAVKAEYDHKMTRG